MFFRSRQRFFGATSLLYGGLYAVMRATIEIFRGDSARRFVVEFDTPTLASLLSLPAREPLFLSTSQAISVAVALAAAAWFAVLRKQQLRG